jgi:hypothetical protein
VTTIPDGIRAYLEAEAERLRGELATVQAEYIEAVKRERQQARDVETLERMLELVERKPHLLHPPHPLIPLHGRFRDDPTWDEYQRNIKEHRGAANAIEGETMHTCPVCGFDGLDEPPENFCICPCCVVEFGYTDMGRSHEELRAAWVAEGMPWRSTVLSAPPGWNPAEQLKSLDARPPGP